ncbi:MAG: hypothetical protein WAU88_15105, partial [Candidatus Zixiibacteriota bacterium]
LSCTSMVRCKLSESKSNSKRSAAVANSVWRQFGDTRLPTYQAKFGTANLMLACFERDNHIWVDYIATNVGLDTLIYDVAHKKTGIAPGKSALLISTDLGLAPQSRAYVRTAKVKVVVPYTKSTKSPDRHVEDVEFTLYRD